MKPWNGNGRNKIVHRNMLYPLSQKNEDLVDQTSQVEHEITPEGNCPDVPNSPYTRNSEGEGVIHVQTIQQLLNEGEKCLAR